MARSSALRSPSAPPAPAGGFALEIDRERRRGRGALSNASGRYEPKARVGFDDGWQSIEDLPPFATTVTGDAKNHHPQRLARYRLRSLDQSLSRLRARLRLLFRAADPRLSRALARARFRNQAVREARGAGAARARAFRAKLSAAHDRVRHQTRSLAAH